MRWIRFFSRVAFICNLFSLLTILVLISRFITQETVVSTIVIIGYALAILINPLVNLCYGILLLLRKPLFKHVPKWLVIVNFVFLLLQVQYIFFLNDQFHH